MVSASTLTLWSTRAVWLIDQRVIKSGCVHELMRRIKGNTRDGRRLLAGVSSNGNSKKGFFEKVKEITGY